MDKPFFRYYLEAFAHPRIVFKQLLADQRNLQFGFWAVFYIFIATGGLVFLVILLKNLVYINRG